MKIAVIDADSVCYSIGNGVKLLDDQGNPLREDGKRFVYRDKTQDELIESADLYMNQILTQGGFTHYILYMKGANTTEARLKINPEYKANRSQIPPTWWDSVQQYLHKHWKAVYVDGMEVDDAVNITRLNLPDSHIVAIDGDLLGLEGTHFNWRKKMAGGYGNEWVTVTAEQAAKKFWVDMIAGQVGDNIKGLVGRGPKYADIILEDAIDAEDMMIKVLKAYVFDLGEEKGIKEYHKNYVSLKTLSDDVIVIPEVIQYGSTGVVDTKKLFE